MKIENPQGNTRDTVIRMIDVSSLWRGAFLDKCIFLERTIDYYLALHFAENDDKAQELIEVLLSNERMTFESKRQVIKYVLDIYDPQFTADNPNFAADLQRLNEFRNILAHYLLDTTEPGVKLFLKDETLRYMKFRNSIEYLAFSKVEYASKLKILEAYMDRFRVLLLTKNNR